MQQAARVSDYTAFMNEGRLVEFGLTEMCLPSRKSERQKTTLQGVMANPEGKDLWID